MTTYGRSAAGSLQVVAAGWVRRGLRRIGHGVRRFVTAWRRSIMLRVVGTTLVLSVLVVLLLVQLVIGQVRDGLLDAKLTSSIAEADAGFRTANTVLTDVATSADVQVTDPGAILDDIAEIVCPSGGQVFDCVLYADDVAAGPDTGSVGPRYSGGALPVNVSVALRDSIDAGAEDRYYEYTMIDYAAELGIPPQSGLVVGSKLNTPGYELYFLFPLNREAETLNLVRQQLLTTGGLLVLLLGLIAYVVTRQVVSPVRMAARISERIAAGQLDERMQIAGEDDLARLASSFNKMAGNLQQQIRQLEDLSRVQRRFVSDVSHELRTPLTTVRMAADVLHEARDTFHPHVARSAELLQAQLDRFEALLSDLLEISRFDAGAASLEAEPADLREIAVKVIEGAEPLAERRGTSIKLLAPRVACVAEVDQRRIERILRNLVGNAIEHSEGQDVIVRVAGNDQAVAVAVRDYGVGLKPGEASLVFNRFWRADPARARTTGGTGLGLPIALEDAHLHGGWLQAWGQPGAGSQFRLTVPRRAGHEMDRSPIPLEPADARRVHTVADLDVLSSPGVADG